METNKDIAREGIITAASIAFSKYGYKKTTLDDIASFTNVSKTGIYYYFTNKEEIFNEVIKREAEKLQNTLSEAISQQNTPIDKLFTYSKVRMQCLEGVSNYYSALKNDLLEHLSAINRNREEFDNIEIRILTDILQEGVDKSDFFIDDVDETAKVIMLTLKSLELPFFGIEKPYDYQKNLERLTNMCLYGILPR